MEDLQELLKKMFGTSTTENADVSLLSDNQTKKTLNLMGLLGSPEALTGLGLISAGMKGQGIGEAILPSFVQGLNVSSTVRTLTKDQEQQKAIEEFAGKVPEQYKPLFKAFPKETMKLLLTPTKPTISGEALKVAQRLKGLSSEEFKQEFAKLSQVDKDLYNKEILGNQDVISQLLSLSGGDMSKFAQTQKGTTVTTTAPMDIKSTSDFQTVKKANPSATDIEIENFLKQKFPNKYK
jgi:hypothetical protein